MRGSISISTRFILLIGIALLLISAFTFHRTFFITRHHLTEIIGQQAEMALEFDLAIRRYAAEKIRPTVSRYLPEEAFVPELMSSTFIARAIFEEVQKKFPEYQLKFSSGNPRNPANRATAAELERIDFFNRNPGITDWSGELVMNGRTYFARLHPDRAGIACLECHGEPAAAPLDLVDRYGANTSFHYPPNEVIGLNTIALPIDTINRQLWAEFRTITWVGGLGVFLLFVAIYCAFQYLIGRRLTTMVSLLKESEANLDPTHLPLLPVHGQDEISRLAESYNTLAERLKANYQELEDRIAERSRINDQLAREIAERKTAEVSLKKMHENLEKLVDERTDKLVFTMVSLEKEILERQLAQNALGIERDKLTNLLNTIPDGVCIRDINQEIEFINPVLEKEFGPGIGRKIEEYFIGIHLPGLAPGQEGQAALADRETMQWEWTSPVNARTYDLVSPPLLNREGEVSTLMILRDITSRKQAEHKLKENERYLMTLMATIQTGVLVTDPETGGIVDANPFAARMIGAPAARLLGRNYQDFLLADQEAARLDHPEHHGDTGQDDCLLTTTTNELVHVRRSFATVASRNKAYFIQSLLDISDIKELLRQQAIDIRLARSILGLINGIPPRTVDLDDTLSLHASIFSMPCHAEGGDHVLLKHLPASRFNKRPRTVISIKDQSGHAVNCIMRSIATDMLHNTFLTSGRDLPLSASTAILNDALLRSDLFEADDFVTAITVEIDHETLTLNYVSAGHPAFLVIRGDSIMVLPELAGPGANLPLAVIGGITFSAGSLPLEPEDRLVFFTDGLLDLPVHHRNKSLTVDELRDVFKAHREEDPNLPVSELILAVLGSLARESSETVIPFTTNTSEDDITIVGLELEIERHDFATILHPAEDTIDDLIAGTFRTMRQALTEQGYAMAEQGLRMVFSEAVINAWKHGNNKDPRKKITVRWRFGNDFHLEVLDEGRGFNFERLRDPTAESNLIRASGRGLFIIRHFSHSVRWKDEGRRIIITFTRHVYPREKEHAHHIEALAVLMRNINKT